jgi:hypothetical protein
MISKSDAIISLGVSGTFWELPSGEIKFADNYIGHKPSEAEIQAKIAELEAAEPMRLLRIQRNRLLQETDWMALNDVVVSEEWKAYRQALRDLPANSEPQLDENGNLTNVTWPTKPGENT